MGDGLSRVRPTHECIAYCFSPFFSMHKLFLIIVFLLSLPFSSQAQPGKVTIMADNLRTLHMIVDDDPSRFPVIKLNSGETLEVSFDDLTHEYRRYTYKIEHCTPDGQPTPDLFESDYVKSNTDQEVIDDYEPSQNTTVLYTHYKLKLPNVNMRPRLSGLYRLSVQTDNEDGDEQTVLQTYFGVVDTQVGIYPTATTNTEVDWNSTHQQLSLRVDCSNIILRDANSEIQTLFMQNRRFDNAVVNPPFTSQNGNALLWEHARSLVFDAGNEYRKMEFMSMRYPGMHGESVRWFDPYYHYTLQTDYPRKNYLYDEDKNGLSIIRCEGNYDPDTEADYALTHFSLQMPELTDGSKVFLSGQWTNEGFAPRYEMHYDQLSQCYQADVLLKSGYYNYLYLTSKDGKHGLTAPIEGDFYQTENEYEIMIYYHPTGSRYWQLVGCVTPKYKKQ